MFVYYIYSFHDEGVERAIEDVNTSLNDPRYRPFHFPSDTTTQRWKPIAKRKIKEADLVVFFMCQKYKEHGENIDYELSMARKYHKKILYVSTDNDPPIELEPFNGEQYLIGANYSVEGLKEYIRRNCHDYSTSDYVFQGREPEKMDNSERRLLFEQYKEMFASTESLMERRQNTSSFYISINTALIALVAAIVALGLDMKLLCVFCIIISLFGIVISKTWSETLESYDRINFSKFNVLESMEKYLPASMFNAEYKDSKNDFLMKSVPSYSKREQKIPLLFKFIYMATALFFALLLILTVFV